MKKIWLKKKIYSFMSVSSEVHTRALYEYAAKPQWAQEYVPTEHIKGKLHGTIEQLGIRIN